jgi:hypothetical protein
MPLHFLTPALAGDPAAACAALDALNAASTLADRELLLATARAAVRAGAALPPPALDTLTALAGDGKESDECRR